MHNEMEHEHHTHEHEQNGHTHTHEHEHNGHTHTHEHQHAHAGQTPIDKTELKALIKFTLEHNEHHLEDLHTMVHQLEDFGEMGAAKELDTAMDDYKQGNAKMQAALKMIKE